MKNFSLQLFADAEAVAGKKIVYLFRVKEDAATDAGTLLAFVTENERTASVDADSTATKDGTIRRPGTAEVEITSTSIVKKDDPIRDKLEEALYANKVVQCWEANLDEPGTGSNKFKGRYFEGYLTEMTLTSSAEDLAEISLTYGANGTGVAGDVTVTAAQQEAASYTFVDTPKTGV